MAAKVTLLSTFIKVVEYVRSLQHPSSYLWY